MIGRLEHFNLHWNQELLQCWRPLLKNRTGWEIALLAALTGFAFCTPISIAMSQPFAYGAVLIWGIYCIREGRYAFVRSVFFAPGLVFILMAFLSVCRSVRPEVSFDKVHRLSLLLLIFVVQETVAGRKDAAIWLLACYLCGCLTLGIVDFFRVPWECLHGVKLFDTGNMRDPQFYMTALCFAVAGWCAGLPFFRSRACWLLSALLGYGLVIHFKRGAWAAAFIAAALTGLLARRWRVLLPLGLVAVMALALPQSRERLRMIPQQWSRMDGGRYTLWKNIAPALINKYPHGMGYAATHSGDLNQYRSFVQPHLNHLHNNYLQIRLELGPLGAAVWLLWMALALGLAIRAWWRTRARTDATTWVALGSLAAFVALQLNGLVEYNFGDTEIIMLYSLILGLIAASQSFSSAGAGATTVEAEASPGEPAAILAATQASKAARSGQTPSS